MISEVYMATVRLPIRRLKVLPRVPVLIVAAVVSRVPVLLLRPELTHPPALQPPPPPPTATIPDRLIDSLFFLPSLFSVCITFMRGRIHNQFTNGLV